MWSATYIILESSSIKGLEKKVNKHLKEDYTLIGGVTIQCWQEGQRFYQAMINK